METEEFFRKEMRWASAARPEASPEGDAWLRGYIQGLRRGFHGPAFRPFGGEDLWARLRHSPVACRRALGIGYEAGIAAMAELVHKGVGHDPDRT